ncbi:glycine cleavage system protein GcvH [Streptomyces sp. NPDC048288]|uniref:glycine cleavage system protein GcvH n=1 Tax=Streptomyces sp. NPDC048288 TaxID=3365529 RepID=UPI0037158543
MANYPTDRKYTQNHEWIQVDGGTATVGITEFAQKQLGDMVFVEVPTVGRKVETGEPFGTVESVKSVSDLFMPVGGEVTEMNTELSDEPELLNYEPHDTWVIKVQVSDKEAIKGLLSAEQYEKYLKSEAG